jgi:hypothetical protein
LYVATKLRPSSQSNVFAWPPPALATRCVGSEAAVAAPTEPAAPAVSVAGPAVEPIALEPVALVSPAVLAVDGGVVPEVDDEELGLEVDDELGLDEDEPGYEELDDAPGLEVEDEELDELGGVVVDVGSSEDELVEPPLDEPPIDELPLDEPPLEEPPLEEPPIDEPELEPPLDVPEAPMPPVVDELLPDPLAPLELLEPAVSLDAERVEPEPDVSPVEAHAPRTSDAAASVEIASDLMRM